ncbi:metal dependent phosphohydrolase [Natrinema altunense JCM 12890]|uniref:Metal dependent phosphohydrolase n=1 Tax=Natrinema altunense (strain JCM 12890 / CGMCC 1.3731 / AJ2) TaxID=1227494 RepID=L9ZUX3_NATA2|nr:metal dependent phosphohydrolase [Natrinema altunense JCM 12890]
MADEHERPVDRAVLTAAAWLHDIGHPLERRGIIENHGEWAPTEGKALLEAEAVATDRIDAIQHCLRTHSVRSYSPKPETLEAEVLFDADKLEATGAVGLVRMACIVGERSGRAGETYAVIDTPAVDGEVSSELPDITLLRDWAEERLEQLYTPSGRRLGTSRWRFMDAFFTQFANEIDIELTEYRTESTE